VPQSLGLGDAIRCAADKVLDSEEPFIVSLGDVIVPKPDLIKRMVAVSKAHGDASVIAVLPVPENQVHRFGIIAGDDLGDGVWKVSTLVEKPPADRAPSNLSIFGRYLLSPKVMDILAHAEPSVGGEIQLTDSLDKLLETEEMYAVVVDSAEGFDTGTVRSWIEANVALALRDPDLGGALRDDLNEMLDNR
jgi:UTP--glucose-1-phosphate uridylyltransferase